MPDPLTIDGVWNSYPIHLKAGQVTYVTIKAVTAIEVVNIDRVGMLWCRLDGKTPEPYKPNNFVVFLSRRFVTNAATRKVALYCAFDRWVSVEGQAY